MQRLGVPDLAHRRPPEAPAVQDDTHYSAEHIANTLSEALKVLNSETESYVQYFEQRFRLEEEHIRELRAMLDKQHDLDARINSKLAGMFGLHSDTHYATGLRAAWADLRTTEYWAVEARTNALNAWKQTTLKKITQFRHEQERIRRRVKDELRSCVGDHAEMLNSTLPRIKKTYERKCEEFETFKHQQRAIDEQRMLLATVEAEGHSPSHAPGDSYFALPQNSNVASSPGGRTPLSLWRKDAAPKRLNALFNRMLDTGEAQPEAQGDSISHPNMIKSHQMLAAKQARAKREMEDAERAYRKAVFDLETLRIRRNKVLSAASKSIMQWRQGLAQTMQVVCAQQARDSMQMCTALQNVHQRDESVATHMLDSIEWEQSRFEETLPSVQLITRDTQVQFVNYHHGAYRDLIFGVSLVDYAFSHGEGGHRPPLIVTKCIDFMELPRAINSPGIYRLSAKQSRIQELSSSIERDERIFQFDAEREDPAAVASILKLYLRQLPEPVLAMPWEERMKYTHSREENVRNGFPTLKARIRRLPQIHQTTLRALLKHLANVAAHSANNKMNVANLAVVFSPVILSETHKEVMSIAAVSEEDKTMEDLITHWTELFNGLSGRETPLPPVPQEQAGAPGVDTSRAISPSPSGPSSAPISFSNANIEHHVPKTPVSARLVRDDSTFIQMNHSQDSSPTPRRFPDDRVGILEGISEITIRAHTPDNK
ncbi:hypothetical protein MCUN1_003256 [Malassezia cuniculi]|uniref:Rho-GAP domain-containing protein n=1 Tax=Malassezia cuniculi TaxID=948313 RepID=A0AAF0EX67_9BASI|nr:hypothetical protein MCUN1_003256 [Malassezia cuniculi]